MQELPVCPYRPLPHCLSSTNSSFKKLENATLWQRGKWKDGARKPRQHNEKFNSFSFASSISHSGFVSSSPGVVSLSFSQAQEQTPANNFLFFSPCQEVPLPLKYFYSYHSLQIKNPFSLLCLLPLHDWCSNRHIIQQKYILNRFQLMLMSISYAN